MPRGVPCAHSRACPSSCPSVPLPYELILHLYTHTHTHTLTLTHNTHTHTRAHVHTHTHTHTHTLTHNTHTRTHTHTHACTHAPLPARPPHQMYLWPCGTTYEGDVQHGKRHGVGIMRFSDSPTVYEGHWVHGMRHGTGTIYFDAAQRHRYIGGRVVLPPTTAPAPST